MLWAVEHNLQRSDPVPIPEGQNNLFLGEMTNFQPKHGHFGTIGMGNWDIFILAIFLYVLVFMSKD
jgi:hypothetical protein